MKWDAKKYDEHHGFVSNYGTDLISYLPKTKHTVLDLGCGTGTLTKKIADLGYDVTGIDSAKNMIEQAKENYPTLDFRVQDILTYQEKTKRYDVVFSNAVFHWISNQKQLLKTIYNLLADDGLLVCEFGAKGNVEQIVSAFNTELEKIGKESSIYFFFPSVKEYQQLLEAQGFTVVSIEDYNRPTPLDDGEAGLKNWMQQFFANDLSTSSSETIIKHVEDSLRGTLWKGTFWEADYRRLRVVAKKS